MIIKITRKYDDQLIDLVLDTLQKNKQAIIFVNSKRSAEKVAEDLSQVSIIHNESIELISKKILTVLDTPTRQCKRLSLCVKSGVAFHHSGLLSKQRNIIEQEFRTGKIKIIVATPTLAAGVDLPAYRVIIRDLKRYSNGRMKDISVMEYLQQAGRAGRPSFDTEGQSIVITTTESEKERILEKYILGEPEEIYSKLAVEPVLRSYVLSLIAGEFFNSEEELLSFFNKTFWAHQYQDEEKISFLLESVIDKLKEWDFLEKTKEQIKKKFRSTYLGKRISELYLDPMSAHDFVKALKQNEFITDFGIISLISCSLEVKPLPTLYSKNTEECLEFINQNIDELLFEPSTEFDYNYFDFLTGMNLAMLLLDWLDEKTEEYIYEKYNVTPGELKARLEIIDWLIYSLIEISKIIGKTSFINSLHKLRIRTKYGCKEELLPLIQIKNIGKIRARKLYNSGIKNIKNLRNADLNQLKRILGNKMTIKILEQVGKKIQETEKEEDSEENQETYIIDEPKENGQTTLNNYR